MPVNLSFTSDGLGVVSFYSGDVVDDDLMAACEFRIEHIQRMSEIRYNIADLRSATSAYFSPTGTMQAARLAREKIMPAVNDLLYIALVDKEDKYGTMRMWMTLSDHDNINNHIAESTEQALSLIHQHLQKHNLTSSVSWPDS